MVRLFALCLVADIAMAADKIPELPPCPASPNCVSSLATDPEHRVEPIAFTGSAEDAVKNLAAIIESEPRARIVTRTERYLHAVFTSLLFRFVDDVQIAAHEDGKRIDIRSASRVGHWDFGVNRRRVERLRGRFEREQQK